MSKKKKTIGEWIAGAFGSSYKTISEKLSAEEHDQFVQDASQLQSKVTAQEGDDDDEDDDNDDDSGDDSGDDTTGDQGADQNEGGTGTPTVEQRLAKMETQLKAQQDENKTLKSQLKAAEKKATQADATSKKLRAAVNPLADEDAVTVNEEEKNLTKADIEARANWKRNQETEE